MNEIQQPHWSTPIVKLDSFRDRATRIEHPFRHFPRTEGQLHAVLGGAGMGKTSLLNVLPEWLLQEPVRHGQHLAPTLIDYHEENGDLESPKAFLLRVVKRLREGLRELGLCTIAERNFEPYFEGRTPIAGFHDALTFLLEQARGASSAQGHSLRDVRLIGLIDDADKIACRPWASDLFRDLRDLYANRELVRRCLDLVLAGEDRLARQFEVGSSWTMGERLSLHPLTPEAVSNWLEEANEGQLPSALAQAIANESGGHPVTMGYFAYEIHRRAARRGGDRLPQNWIDRMVEGFIQQHQDVLDIWARSLWQTEPAAVIWTTYRLLAEAGDVGLDMNDIDDRLWAAGVRTDVEQVLERLVWLGVVSPISDGPGTFAATRMFRRYCQLQPIPDAVQNPPVQPALTSVTHRDSPKIEYVDFNLRLSKEGDHYRVRVTSCWGEANSEFRNPIPPSEQAGIWQSVIQQGYSRDIMPLQPQPVSRLRKIETIGGDLFRAIFHDEILARLRSARENTTRERLGLRIKLILEPSELHSLPWELLYDDEGPLEFLALSKWTPLVRYVEQPTHVSVFKQVERLRLLFVVASPENYPALNLEHEVENMRTALEPLRKLNRLEYKILQGREANVDTLQQLLLHEDYHVFHFLGHGTFDDELGQGVLLLEGIDGRGERLAAQQLARLLRDVIDIRLVFLNACETALSTETSPFASVAGALVKVGVPGVVASQHTISDRAAISFASKFYQALAESQPLETAVAEGRKAIDLSEKNYEWGVPVLYLHAQDGRMF